MQLLFRSRRTRKLHFRSFIIAVAVLIQADDWARPVVDLLFVSMRCVLDLAPLIPFFHGSKHAPEPLDLAELFEDRRFHSALDCFHAGRTAQHVHGVFENAGLLKQDRLPVRGEPDPFFARRRERFVRAVGMTRIRRVHVRQDQFRGRPGEIVFEFGSD